MSLKHRQQAGITLAEVLVAIAILLVGVFAVMRVFPAGLKVIQNDRMSDIATQLNRQRLAFYRAQPLLGRASQVTQPLPPQMDRLSGAHLRQPLMVPDAVVLMTSVSADTGNLFLPYGEADNVERRFLIGRTPNYFDVQPNFLPANRLNPPTGCADPEDPDAPWCHAMAAWKRIIGEPHVVQELTDGTGNRFMGIVLGHAPIYFNPPQGSNPPDPLNPIFHTETPVPVVVDAPNGELVGLAAGTYKVSYRWVDKNDVEHGVDEEMFFLPAAGNYVVAAAFERGNLSSLWGGQPGKTGRLLEGTVRVVRVDWVPAAPAMIRTAVGMDKVGLVDLTGVTGALPGAIVKANYTIHVTY
ncbi:MAG: prepilin-type N-terminal cleavage/methylation domain-containing protein, partial [Abditibacteriales bacterium]|nr:prepilin-type N-terminal cleavage/methylation domain-containing protein [Abditibacteriales bacterium]